MLNYIGKLLVIFSFFGCQPKFKTPEVRRVMSFTFNECRCQFYDINKVEKLSNLVPCEDFFAEHFPDEIILPNILYCDDLVGFSAESWGKNITPKAKELMRWGQDNCQ